MRVRADPVQQPTQPPRPVLMAMSLVPVVVFKAMMMPVRMTLPVRVPVLVPMPVTVPFRMAAPVMRPVVVCVPVTVLVAHGGYLIHAIHPAR